MPPPYERVLCICRLGAYAVRALSCTCRSLHRSIGFEERRIATRPLMQFIVYDGPIMVNETPATPAFSCQHRPCCADQHAHMELIRANAAHSGRRGMAGDQAAKTSFAS